MNFFTLLCVFTDSCGCDADHPGRDGAHQDAVGAAELQPGGRGAAYVDARGRLAIAHAGTGPHAPEGPPLLRYGTQVCACT